jgi:non-canonical (house-cleaning) NTP pyrophosphatase
MPMSIGAIVSGAYARAGALAALPAFAPGEDLALGLEGGLDPLHAGELRGWMLHTWAVATDGRVWGVGAGPALRLPPRVADRVVGGEELGDVIDSLAGTAVRGTRGAWGVLTADTIGRREAFRLAVIAALAPFYNGALWD